MTLILTWDPIRAVPRCKDGARSSANDGIVDGWQKSRVRAQATRRGEVGVARTRRIVGQGGSEDSLEVLGTYTNRDDESRSGHSALQKIHKCLGLVNANILRAACEKEDNVGGVDPVAALRSSAEDVVSNSLERWRVAALVCGALGECLDDILETRGREIGRKCSGYTLIGHSVLVLDDCLVREWRVNHQQAIERVDEVLHVRVVGGWRW